MSASNLNKPDGSSVNELNTETSDGLNNFFLLDNFSSTLSPCLSKINIVNDEMHLKEQIPFSSSPRHLDIPVFLWFVPCFRIFKIVNLAGNSSRVIMNTNCTGWQAYKSQRHLKKIPAAGHLGELDSDTEPSKGKTKHSLEKFPSQNLKFTQIPPRLIWTSSLRCCSWPKEQWCTHTLWL